jgi:hypothetical protein
MEERERCYLFVPDTKTAKYDNYYCKILLGIKKTAVAQASFDKNPR